MESCSLQECKSHEEIAARLARGIGWNEKPEGYCNWVLGVIWRQVNPL